MAGFENDVIYADNVNFNPGSPQNSGQVTSDGQLLIGNNVDPKIRVGNITSSTLDISYVSPDLVIDAGTSVATTYTTDSGSATPSSNILNIVGGTGIATSGSSNIITINAASDVATTYTTDDSNTASASSNNINIFGGPGVTTTSSSDTITINSVVFSDQATSTSVTSDSGSFLTGGSAQTYTLPASPSDGELCIFVRVSDFDHVISAAGSQIIRIGSSSTSAGGTVTSSSISDALTLRYRSTDTTWYATSIIGVWVLS